MLNVDIVPALLTLVVCLSITEISFFSRYCFDSYQPPSTHIYILLYDQFIMICHVECSKLSLNSLNGTRGANDNYNCFSHFRVCTVKVI